MRYRMKPTVMQELLAHAQQGAPREVCGLAFGGIGAGTVEFYSALLVPNVAKDPVATFEIDGHTFRHAYELAERSGLLLAVWHSHPDSQPTPSQEDFALISQLFDIPFIIVGVKIPAITIYERVELGRVREAYRESVKGL